MVEEEAHVLRYWETEFAQLRPKKNKAGKRIYKRADVDTIFRIRHLLREEKYTLEGAMRALSLKPEAVAVDGETEGDLAGVRILLEQMLERIRE